MEKVEKKKLGNGAETALQWQKYKENELLVVEDWDTVAAWVEEVAVVVKEAHQELGGGHDLVFSQLEIVHVRNNQQNQAVRAQSTYKP